MGLGVLVVALIAAVGLSTGFGSASTNATPPVAGPGSLEAATDWPLIAIHSTVDRNGNVLTFGTDEQGMQGSQFVYDVWTPGASTADNHHVLDNTTETNIFCAAVTTDPVTGEIVIFGGDLWQGDRATGNSINEGNPDITIFDPGSRALTSAAPMAYGRWYAGWVTMADGRIYVQGGSSERAKTGFEDGSKVSEVWTAAGGPQVALNTEEVDWYYPRMFLKSDGSIVGFAQGDVFTIPEDLSAINKVERMPDGLHARNLVAVMYEQDKVLITGGGNNQAWILDFTGDNPVFTQTGDIDQQRSWANGTLLPDGRVLLSGGGTLDSIEYPWEDEFFDRPLADYEPAMTLMLWDPATGEWTTGPEQRDFRYYHSTSLLLPTGEVLLAGGGAPGPVDNLTAQAYRSSNYSGDFTATVDQETIQPGDSFGLTAERDIGQVVLMRVGASTHAMDVDQRRLIPDTDNSDDPKQVTVKTDANPAVFTPGSWMVFVYDTEGLLSQADMLWVKPPDA